MTAIEGKYTRKVHRWLAAPDPSVSHKAARKKHQQSPPTGAWLLESQRCTKWMRNPYSFLWLHGPRKLLIIHAGMSEALTGRYSRLWQERIMGSPLEKGMFKPITNIVQLHSHRLYDISV